MPLAQPQPRSPDKINTIAKWTAVSSLAACSIAGLTIAALRAPEPSRDAERPAAVPGTPSPLARRININTAPAATLELLPGIGPTLALRIIEHRKRQGHFEDLESLDNVHGIGSRTIDQLRPYAITTD